MIYRKLEIDAVMHYWTLISNPSHPKYSNGFVIASPSNGLGVIQTTEINLRIFWMYFDFKLNPKNSTKIPLPKQDLNVNFEIPYQNACRLSSVIIRKNWSKHHNKKKSKSSFISLNNPAMFRMNTMTNISCSFNFEQVLLLLKNSDLMASWPLQTQKS